MFCLFAATRPRLIRIVIFCLRHHIGFRQTKSVPKPTSHSSRYWKLIISVGLNWIMSFGNILCGNYNRLSFNLLKMNWRKCADYYHFTEIIIRFSLETVFVPQSTHNVSWLNIAWKWVNYSKSQLLVCWFVRGKKKKNTTDFPLLMFTRWNLQLACKN